MMPLCTTAISPPETCGCALTGVGAPCVAQRVCAMPVVPVMPPACDRASRSATRAVLTTRCSRAGDAPSPSRSRRGRPSRSRGTRAAGGPRSGPERRCATRPRRRCRTWLAGPLFSPRRLRWRASLLARPLPAGDRHLLRARNRELAGRGVAGQRGAGAERRAATDGHRRDQLRVGADEDVVLDHGAVLVRAVVVAGDGAGADVDVAADGRVADVGEMIGLAARGRSSDALTSTKLPMCTSSASTAPGRSRAYGPDPAAGADGGAVEVRERRDHACRRRRSRRAARSARRSRRRRPARTVALEHAADVDAHVAAAGERAAQVDARRDRRSTCRRRAARRRRARWTTRSSATSCARSLTPRTSRSSAAASARRPARRRPPPSRRCRSGRTRAARCPPSARPPSRRAARSARPSRRC